MPSAYFLRNFLSQRRIVPSVRGCGGREVFVSYCVGLTFFLIEAKLEIAPDGRKEDVLRDG